MKFSLSLTILCLQSFLCAQQPAADMVVINAKVRTMTERTAVSDAFAVSGNKITSVGTNKLIQKLIGPATRVIDAKGRVVIPGFNDAHVHFMGIGNSFSSIDLREAKTQSEITGRIQLYLQFLPRGRWILGRGWTSASPPDRSAIDKVAPDNPVFVYAADGQTAFASGLAFKLAGIKTDESTGIVRGDAMKRIANAVPPDHTRSWHEIAETATNFAASLGVTSVQDMHSDDSREIYRELERQGKLKNRVYDCISLPDWRKLAGSGSPSNTSDLVRGGCLKSFSDGDEASRAFLLRDVPGADKAGLQIMIHAIGNSANDIVLGVFEQTVKTNGKRDRRFRVEHAHNPRQGDLVRYVRSNVIASMQPHLFEYGNGEYYATLLKQRTVVAFGSDAAITDLDPMLGIHAAVNAGVESISVYDAVHAYTVGSAYAEFQEKAKGTIQAGRLADFVILSDDIFTISPTHIRGTKVITTVVGGRIVFQAN